MSEKAVYVKGKASTTYAVLGLGYGARGVPARHRSRPSAIGFASPARTALGRAGGAGTERYDFVRPFQDLIMGR